MALVGMGESERALKRYGHALERFPDGELREEAEAALRAKGLLVEAPTPEEDVIEVQQSSEQTEEDDAPSSSESKSSIDAP
jgi:hypothetical protein